MFASDDIETAHLTAWLAHRSVVRNTGTKHDGVAHDGRRRCLFIVGKPARSDAQPVPQVHHAVVAEVGDRLAGPGIQRDQPRINGRDENAPLASSRLPCRYAAVGEIAVAFVLRNLGVIRPALLSGHRVERNHAPQRRSQIQRPIDVNRGRLECGRTPARRFVHVTGAKRPRHLERRYVSSVDDRQRRKALPSRVAPICWPLVIRLCREHQQRGARQQRHARRHDHWQPTTHVPLQSAASPIR